MTYEEIKESLRESRLELTHHFETLHRINGLRSTLRDYKTLDHYEKILESQKTLNEEERTRLTKYQETLKEIIRCSKRLEELDTEGGHSNAALHLDLFDDIVQGDKSYKKNNDSEKNRLPLPVQKEFKRFVDSLHTFLHQATRKNKNFYIGALEKYSDNASFAREEDEHGVSIVIRVRRKSPVKPHPLPTAP